MSKGREPKARVEPVFYGEVYKDEIRRTDTKCHIKICPCCQEYRSPKGMIEFPGMEDVCEFLYALQRP